MLPDNKDALKVWLVETLNPICDADPDTLANYVLALIKKDKSEDDLVELCNRDLEVFLQDHTKGFVDRLFEALRSKDYLFEGDRVCTTNPPQATQKLATSPSLRGEPNPHLTYKNLPKRDQEQIRPKEFDQMMMRRQDRRPDVVMDGRDRWRQDRRRSKSPQARNRNDSSRERPRRKFSQVRNRANEQSPRDVISPPLRLGKRSYTRSLSKSVDPHELEQQERHSSRETSGSLSPDSNNKASKRSRSNSNQRREGIKKQRCRMYYERGFCELGDKCPYDHGKNPVLISNRELSLPNSYEYSPSNYLSPQGVPPLLHQTVMPNISQPPPALPFSHHRMPPPHFLPQPGNLLLTQPPLRQLLPFGLPPTYRPPPTVYPFMHLANNNLYQPGAPPAVEPYMPEPYTSKPSHFNLPPPSIQGQASIVKGTWKEGEEELKGSVTPITSSVRQVSNLVHVSIEEGGKLADADPDVISEQPYEVSTPGEGNIPSYTPTPSSVLMARKRSPKTAGLESLSSVAQGALQVHVQSDASETEDAKLMPPPSSYIKKAAIEHPGENLLPVPLGVTGRNQSMTNTTLELRKIPREDNTIANINDHFSKFGIIVNLQVNWDSDPCAALVSYASSAQASAAYRSKEPFLNNRFIKIFWHNPEKSQQGGNLQVGSDTRLTDKEFKPKPKYTIPQRHQLQLNRIKKPEEVKKGQEPEVTTEKTEDETSKTAQDPTSPSSDPSNVPSVNPTTTQGTADAPERPVIPPRSALKLQRKPIKEIQKVSAIKKEMELRQMKQEYLNKLLETQKKLVDTYVKSKGEDKARCSQLLKDNEVKISEITEELKKPLTNFSSPPGAGGLDSADAYRKPPHHTSPRGRFNKNNKLVRNNSNSGLTPNAVVDDVDMKQGAQKAILDGELDMMANKSNHKSKEADVLKKKISDIKDVIDHMSKDGEFQSEDGAPSSSYPFNKFNYNQNPGKSGRAFAKVVRSVDRRPRQVLITGFSASEDKSALLNHMKNFGQVEKSLYDNKTPFYLVTYRYRSDAERAMKDGAIFHDIKLKLNWHKSEPQTLQPSKPTSVQNKGVPSSVSPSFSSSSSAHIHPGMMENKVDDLQDRPGFGVSEVQPAGDDGSSPIVGGGEGYIDDDELNEYRRWGDGDEDSLLYEEEDDDEDDDEGVRPWRRR